MDDAEIEKIILLGWYWENIETCQEQNQWYARWIKEYPDRIDAFAALNATADVASDIVTWAVDNGFKGIGECLPQVQGHTLRDSCWRNAMEACVAKNLSTPVCHRTSARLLWQSGDATRRLRVASQRVSKPNDISTLGKSTSSTK